LGDSVATKINNTHESGLGKQGENPFQSRITEAKTKNNQPLIQQIDDRGYEKTDMNHQKAAMRVSKICVKNASPPENLSAKRSQGGVQLPTGGNCAQCA
jgi:hypothetical protein